MLNFNLTKTHLNLSKSYVKHNIIHFFPYSIALFKKWHFSLTCQSLRVWKFLNGHKSPEWLHCFWSCDPAYRVYGKLGHCRPNKLQKNWKPHLEQPWQVFMPQCTLMRFQQFKSTRNVFQQGLILANILILSILTIIKYRLK